MTSIFPPSVPSTLLQDLRASTPLIQCLTNAVVTNFTANALLALGAAPAMTDIPGEAGPFAELASGVLINLGTPHKEQRAAMKEAAAAAGAAGTPWVLDPVAVGALPVRTALAAELLELNPTAIRGNASEILALAGLGSGGRGVDATENPEQAVPAAQKLAAEYGAVVAVSGPTDVITDGSTVIRLTNGSPLLTRITGGGCALGAVTAAFLSVARPDDGGRLAAVASATAVYTVAADLAAAEAAGPGTFGPAFLDALSRVAADDLERLLVSA